MTESTQRMHLNILKLKNKMLNVQVCFYTALGGGVGVGGLKRRNLKDGRTAQMRRLKNVEVKLCQDLPSELLPGG